MFCSLIGIRPQKVNIRLILHPIDAAETITIV